MEDTILLKKLNDWAGTSKIDYLSEDTGLSACFKWLLPKLLGYALFKQGKHHVGIAIPHKGDVGFCDNGKTPALAFCLAIEKMIGQEVDNAKE